MNKNSLKKAMSALAVAAVAASASSVAALAADYPNGQEGYGKAGDTLSDGTAAAKPVLSLNVDGKDNEAVYDNAADIAGKTITCTLDVSGANKLYASTGLHVFYDSRLKLVPDEDDSLAVAGSAIDKLMADVPTADPTAPEGFSGVFLATAGKQDLGKDGTMWTFTFEVPADAKKGDVFPIDIIYRNESAEDLFCNKAVDEAGLTMQANTFVNGIYNSARPFAASSANVAKVAALANIDTTMDAYIAIADEVVTEPTSEAPATTTSEAASTTAKAGSTTAKAGSTTTKAGSTTKASTTAKADAPKTGVAGCGVAVAGLAVALGTAFVLRKKED